MRANEANILLLTGGRRLKTRVQHPKIHERKDRKGHYWFFRAWVDEPQSDGTIKTTRKFFTIGRSRGDDAIGKKEADAMRDSILAKLNTPTVKQALAKGPTLF